MKSKKPNLLELSGLVYVCTVISLTVLLPFNLPNLPVRLWSILVLYFCGSPGHFPWAQIDHSLNITTYQHTVSSLRMCGAITPLTSASSCRNRGKFTTQICHSWPPQLPLPPIYIYMNKSSSTRRISCPNVF